MTIPVSDRWRDYNESLREYRAYVEQDERDKRIAASKAHTKARTDWLFGLGIRLIAVDVVLAAICVAVKLIEWVVSP